MAEIICIVCPKGCHLDVIETDSGMRVTGNQCARGAEYGPKELKNPTRVLTSTVRVEDAMYPRLPVKTDRDIPKPMIFDIMAALENLVVAAPVVRGQVLLRDVCGSGANIVATRDLRRLE